jgi:manganese/zinc/iron transport system substrate-binding protein
VSRISILLFACLMVLAGCATPQQSERGPVSVDNPLQIVATTSLIADLVDRIGGDLVDVEGLMGQGVDPHLYQASEGDVSSMTEADLIFYNGLHLEGKMVDIFEQMHSRGSEVHAVTAGVEESELIASEQFTGSLDPHIWFDPVLWKRAAVMVGETLAGSDSLHAEYYRDEAARFGGELDSLFAWAAGQMASVPERNRVLITSHDAFGYFGRAFDMDVRGLQGISTALEAGTADVSDLAEFVASSRIPAMFVESSISPRGIEAVREAVRARGFDVQIGGTLYGDALGSPGTAEASYVGIFRSNVATIVSGLSANVQ